MPGAGTHSSWGDTPLLWEEKEKMWKGSWGTLWEVTPKVSRMVQAESLELQAGRRNAVWRHARGKSRGIKSETQLRDSGRKAPGSRVVALSLHVPCMHRTNCGKCLFLYLWRLIFQKPHPSHTCCPTWSLLVCFILLSCLLWGHETLQVTGQFLSFPTLQKRSACVKRRIDTDLLWSSAAIFDLLLNF